MPGEAVPATVHKTILKVTQQGCENLRNPLNLLYGKLATAENCFGADEVFFLANSLFLCHTWHHEKLRHLGIFNELVLPAHILVGILPLQ